MELTVGMALMNLQTLQQPHKLPPAYLHYRFRRCRPAESFLLQSFLPKTKSIPIPVENLDHGSPAIAENKQVAAERIQRELLRNQDGQSIDGFPHVCIAHRQIYFQTSQGKHYITPGFSAALPGSGHENHHLLRSGNGFPQPG